MLVSAKEQKNGVELSIVINQILGKLEKSPSRRADADYLHNCKVCLPGPHVVLHCRRVIDTLAIASKKTAYKDSVEELSAHMRLINKHTKLQIWSITLMLYK